jgi:hypothetical protein
VNRYHATFVPGSKGRKGAHYAEVFTCVSGSRRWVKWSVGNRCGFDDILGRWCVVGLGNSNTFAKTKLLVQFPNGNNRALEILKTEINGNRIRIWWTYKPDANTVYEISGDRRTLVQLPNTSGDMGPRLELHRC